MSKNIIIIGAGHNGLVAAAYLAKAGQRVTVLERRGVVGGACVTEELLPGARFSSCAYVMSSLRPQIIRELELKRHGLETYTTDVLNFALGEDGQHFFLWPAIDRSLESLRSLGERGIDNFADFGLRFRRFAKLVEPYLLAEPPTLSELLERFEAAGEVALWHEFVTGSVDELVRRYFSHDLVRGLFTFFGLVSCYGSPQWPGTAYEFSHHSWGEYEGEFGRFGFARGGMGAITTALAAAVRTAGGEIHLNTEVSAIETTDKRLSGIRLRDGTRLPADIVLSSADPKRTYLGLLDSNALPATTRNTIHDLDFRGSMARVHLLVDELPEYIGFGKEEGPQHRGFTLLGGTPSAYEGAWEAQRQGELFDRYPIELIIQSVTDPTLAPAGLHTISTGIQQLPFTLRHGDWDTRRDEFTERVIASMSRFAPNLPSSIRGSVTITPLDLERTYGLSEGNIFHGAMSLPQLFASRPASGLGGYTTPIDGLYLCGAGTHPGGAVMGACGHNAAQVVLAQITGQSSRSLPPTRRRGQVDMLDRIASHPRLRTARGWALRQPWLRPLVRAALRR